MIICTYFIFFLFSRCRDHQDLHSFPTRRSSDLVAITFRMLSDIFVPHDLQRHMLALQLAMDRCPVRFRAAAMARSEEHTSELQSRPHLVCRLLREKKTKGHLRYHSPTDRPNP